MALVVLRTYAMLSEAQVAAAALRAAGIEPVLLDQASAPPYSGLTAMGGFRLAVAQSEAREAVEVLREDLARPLPAEDGDGYDAPDTAWREATAPEGPRRARWSPAMLREGLTLPRLGVLLLLLMLLAAAAWGSLSVTGSAGV